MENDNKKVIEITMGENLPNMDLSIKGGLESNNKQGGTSKNNIQDKLKKLESILASINKKVKQKN